jgi:hypothetical protein
MRLTLRSLTLRALFILSSISFALAGAGCKGGLGPGGGNDGGEPSTLACTTSSDCTRTEIDHEIHSAADCVCLYGCPFAIVNVETANRRMAQYQALCALNRLNCGVDDCVAPAPVICSNEQVCSPGYAQ